MWIIVPIVGIIMGIGISSGIDIFQSKRNIVVAADLVIVTLCLVLSGAFIWLKLRREYEGPTLFILNLIIVISCALTAGHLTPGHKPYWIGGLTAIILTSLPMIVPRRQSP